MSDRRTFLRGLATLPLIGGSVAVIGNPTRAAVPITDALLSRYDRWLDLERSRLRFEMFSRWSYMAPEHPIEVIFYDRRTDKAFNQHAIEMPGVDFDHTGASGRAAVVLSAVGCPLAGEGS